jgi:hypothetical protein
MDIVTDMSLWKYTNNLSLRLLNVFCLSSDSEICSYTISLLRKFHSDPHLTNIEDYCLFGCDNMWYGSVVENYACNFLPDYMIPHSRGHEFHQSSPVKT